MRTGSKKYVFAVAVAMLAMCRQGQFERKMARDALRRPIYNILYICSLALVSLSFFYRSLVKRVNVGLSVQPIEDEMVEEIMVQGGSVSPIVTIEPRRRKFHKPITVTMPLPEKMSAQYLRRKRDASNGSSAGQQRCKTPIGRSNSKSPKNAGLNDAPSRTDFTWEEESCKKMAALVSLLFSQGT